MGQFLQQKYKDMAYPGKVDHNYANTVNSFKIRCHFFGARTGDNFEPVIMEYKREKWSSIIFEPMWLFSKEGCTIWMCTVLKPLKRD